MEIIIKVNMEIIMKVNMEVNMSKLGIVSFR